MKKHILHVTSEVAPFYKRGGLGDVLGALPFYLNSSEYVNIVISQYYDGCMTDLDDAEAFGFSMQIHGIEYPYTCYQTTKNGVDFYFLNLVDNHLFSELESAGDGDQPYKGTSSFMYYIYFAKTALDLIKRLSLAPLHIFCHDWQACGIFAFKNSIAELRDQFNTSTILVIHNYDFQGKILEDAIPYLPVEARAEMLDTLDKFDLVTMLGLGINKSDYVATVSKSYAEELMSGIAPHKGLCFLKDGKEVISLFNGVDYDIWHPENSPFLPNKYDTEFANAKRLYKSQVFKEYNFHPIAENERVPLVLFMARLTIQKGIQLFTAKENIEKIEALLNGGIRVIIHGNPSGGFTGDVHKSLLALSKRFEGQLQYDPEYSDEKAHKLLAAADILLVPSLFEPCGLVQIYAMAFGTVPVVRATGGLKDSVLNFGESQNATGFHFSKFKFEEMRDAIFQASTVYQRSEIEWNQLVENGMNTNFSWNKMTSNYYELLKRIEHKKAVLIDENDQNSIINQNY